MGVGTTQAPWPRVALAKLRGLGEQPGDGTGVWAGGEAAGAPEGLTAQAEPPAASLSPAPRFSWMVGSPPTWRGCGRGRLSHRIVCVMTGYIYSWVARRHYGYGSPQFPGRPGPVCSPSPALPHSLSGVSHAPLHDPGLALMVAKRCWAQGSCFSGCSLQGGGGPRGRG